MTVREFARVCLVACVLVSSRAAAADDATLFRLFLKDGGSLVSYGEVARVDDRVVFSMPTSAGPNPALHLVNIPADRVDWDRTDRYAASARSGRYLETQAENDYTALSNQISASLNDVTLTDDPARRLAIVEDARKTLAEWPSTHYNYREADIRQLSRGRDRVADGRPDTAPTISRAAAASLRVCRRLAHDQGLW